MNNSKWRPKSKSKNGKPSRFQGAQNRRRNNGKGGLKPSELDPRNLVKKAVAKVESSTVQRRKFSELPLHPQLKERIAKKGFSQLTEIQDRSIEWLAEGRDVLGIANTGTGKTGAFLIPIIHQLLSEHRPFQTLVLVPTRELAVQVQEEFTSLTKGLKLFSISLIGGTSISRDIHRLRRMHHLVIGTPGRTMDLIRRESLDIRKFSTLVLDEFDRMLDMGFRDEVKRIVGHMPSRKQTILFSATENKGQKALIEELLYQPKAIRVSSGKESAEHIDQDVVKVAQGEDKFKVLLDMVQSAEYEKVLVFAETKRRVSRISSRLSKSGVRSDEIHGDKSQNYRQRALDRFRAGGVKVLVATDVAARGIDVDDITHVINYQLPQTMESYVHRIGRTGRAGKMGKAVTLVD